MLRSLLLYLSHAAWARRFITWFPLSRRAAGRFIAGETAADAIRVIRELNGRGIRATVDHLGENVASPEDAARAADAYLAFLEQTRAEHIQSHVSVKLTHLGLDLGEEVCRANLRRIAERARECGSFVRVDMEGTAYTDQTLAIVEELHRQAGFGNVGTVIQAYLYRSEADVRGLIADGVCVRLCKGAYDEPPDRAYPRKADVDASFVSLARLLLEAVAAEGGREHGLYPAFATHDEKMVAAVKQYAAEQRISPKSFEFQMLHGIRRDLQYSLVGEGYGVRVYVPYGRQWYPYFMRRLAERPANLWFFVFNLARR